MQDLTVPLQWLKRVGFGRGNPFSENNAEQDESLLYVFVKFPYFDEILGNPKRPTSTFLVAPRGGGKSANRRMLEQGIQEDTRVPVLVVPYLDAALVGQANAGTSGRISVLTHVERICQHATLALLAWLQEHPERVVALTPESYGALFKWHLNQIRGFCTPLGLDRWLKSANLYTPKLNGSALFRAAEGAQKIPQPFNPNVQPLIELVGELLSPKTPLLDLQPLNAFELLERFVELSQEFGIKTVYILVDRVDEAETAAFSPQMAAQQLMPLATDLLLLEMPHVAFKFFVPTTVAVELRRLVRMDRVRFYEVEWTDEKLLELFNGRVQYFSQARRASFDELMEQGSDAVTQLIKSAEKSPRRLLRTGEWLLYERYARNPATKGYISKKDVEAAIRRTHKEYSLTSSASVEEGDTEKKVESDQTKEQSQVGVREQISRRGIHLDARGSIWRDGKKLDQPLSANEFRLFEILYEHAGKRVSIENLIAGYT